MNGSHVRRFFREEVDSRPGGGARLAGRVIYLPPVRIALAGINFDPSQGGPARAYVQLFSHVLSRKRGYLTLGYGGRVAPPGGSAGTWDLSDGDEVRRLGAVVALQLLPELERRQDPLYTLSLIEASIARTHSPHEMVDRAHVLLSLGRSAKAARTFEEAARRADDLHARGGAAWLRALSTESAGMGDEVRGGRYGPEDAMMACQAEIQKLKLVGGAGRDRI